jgi:ATP-binding protein involved in chromosome partitioning
VPLLPEIRAGGDAGKPIVVDQPDGAAAGVFRTMAQSLLDRLGSAGR